MTDQTRPNRSDFTHYLMIPTRWMDNDIYGHVNNALYYAYFDTVINEYLISEGGLDIQSGAVIALAVETHCQFFQSISFPQVIAAGLRAARIGNTSVRYEVGLFREDEEAAAAFGYFAHVFVDRDTRRPFAIPERIRAALERIAVGKP
jgi:acyl-CoA thioester hydrolase